MNLHNHVGGGGESAAEAKGTRRDADFFNISRIDGTSQVGCITTIQPSSSIAPWGGGEGGGYISL